MLPCAAASSRLSDSSTTSVARCVSWVLENGSSFLSSPELLSRNRGCPHPVLPSWPYPCLPQRAGGKKLLHSSCEFCY